MNFQNNKYKLEIADSDSIKYILEKNAFSGGISVSYLRGDNPLLSFKKEGTPLMYVLKDTGSNMAVGMGGCIIRDVVIGNKILKAGYLSGLKIIPEYRNKVLCIPDIYKYLYEQSRPYVDFYYTSILTDNQYAVKMFEKKRKNMPEYIFLENYNTYFIRKNMYYSNKYVIKQGLSQDILDFYKNESSKYSFLLHNIDNYINHGDFYGLYDNTNLIGAGYVTNQSSYKQYKVENYSGIYKLISKLPLYLLNYPKFPKEKECAKYLSSSILVKNNDYNIGLHFLSLLLKNYKDYDFIMIGFSESDTLNKIIEKIRHITYKSRIYYVSWGDYNYYDEIKKYTLKHDVSFL